MKKKSLGIYAPWVIYAKQIEALFAKDAEVGVSYDDDSNTVEIYVENAEKADAISKILPTQKVFGKVVLNITVIPANGKTSAAKTIETAFKGNEAFSHMTIIEEIPDFYITNPIAYCSFKKEVVQYAADDLSSETGMKSTLYEDLARELLENTDGVYFCTDKD